MTVRAAIAQASAPIGRRDAETLLAHLLGRGRAWLLAHPEAELTAAQAAAFAELTARRAGHEPLQYLTGRQEFFRLPLRVTPETLIPRPETELLVEAVLAWAAGRPQPLHIVDVGTGTGAIALALATHLPEAEITAVEISAAALEVARQNAEDLGLGDRIVFRLGDLLGEAGTGQRFDVVVSNPPYVATTDASTLAAEVREFEPHGALFAGPDGLAVYRRLVPAAHAALVPGGLLALEFGFGQREALRGLLEGGEQAPAWRELRFLDDYANIPRVALAVRSEGTSDFSAENGRSQRQP
jgi:release factor glutamine methyltransferase